MLNKKIVTLVVSVTAAAAVGAGCVFASGGGFGFKFGETQEKWNALSDAQKADVYAASENELAARAALLDKYVEVGLLDSETAELMKSGGADALANAKEAGTLPANDMRGGGKMRMGAPGEMPERPELSDEQKAQMRAEMKSKLDEAVSAGKLTQEEADKRLAELDEGKAVMMGGRGRGMGGFGGEGAQAAPGGRMTRGRAPANSEIPAIPGGSNI